MKSPLPKCNLMNKNCYGRPCTMQFLSLRFYCRIETYCIIISSLWSSCSDLAWIHNKRSDKSDSVTQLQAYLMNENCYGRPYTMQFLSLRFYCRIETYCIIISSLWSSCSDLAWIHDKRSDKLDSVTQLQAYLNRKLFEKIFSGSFCL